MFSSFLLLSADTSFSSLLRTSCPPESASLNCIDRSEFEHLNFGTPFNFTSPDGPCFYEEGTAVGEKYESELPQVKD